jgi:hypothetical protein
MNAMIGRKLLPTGANRVTGVVTRLRFGRQMSARVVHKNGQGIKTIPFSEIPDYIKLDTSKGISIAPDSVEYVDIDLPDERFTTCSVYIDTPGLRDLEELDRRVQRELEMADLAVMLIDATKAFGDDEQAEASRVNTLLNGNLIFLITHLETIGSDAFDAINWVQEALKNEEFGNSVVGKPKVFPLYSRHALDARLAGINDAVALEGLVDFENWLRLRINCQDGLKLAAVSRLGVVSMYVHQALAYYSQCSELAKAAVQAAETSFANQQERALLSRRQFYLSASQNLRGIRNSLVVQTDTLKNFMMTNTEQVLTTSKNPQQDAINQLQSCARSFIEYVQKLVEPIAQPCLGNLEPFNPTLTIGGTQIKTDKSASWGLATGVTAALMIAFPPAGVLAGAYFIGSKIKGSSEKSESLKKLKEMIDAIASQIITSSCNYCDRIISQLEEGANLRPQLVNPPALLINLRFEVQSYLQTIEWCQKLALIISEIIGQLT